MTRKFWLGVMMVSLVMTGGASMFINSRLDEKATRVVPLQKPKPRPLQPVKKSTFTVTTTSTATVKKPTLPNKSNLRNILFTLFSSRAKKVMIVGDFNNWHRKSLRKKGKGKWTTSLRMAPGTYKYMYVIDGRRVRDPNNKRVSKDGKSVLIVKPISKK